MSTTRSEISQTITEYVKGEDISYSVHDTARYKLLGGDNLIDAERASENNVLYEYFAASALSEGYNAVTINRIKSLTSNFVYNYFERDEKQKDANNKGNGIVEVINKENLGDDKYSILTNRKPRYVELSMDLTELIPEDLVSFDKIKDMNAFSGATDDDINALKGVFGINADNQYQSDLFDMQTFMDYAIFEGSLSSNNSTGIEYFDTYADKNAYRIFSSSISFNDLSQPSDSLTNASRKFIDNLEDNDNIFTLQQKTDLLSVMSSLNVKNIKANDSMQGISNQFSNIFFSTKYNNLFISDIVENSTVTLNHIYADENLGLIQKDSPNVKSVQENAIAAATAESNDSNGFSPDVIPLPGSLRVFEYGDAPGTQLDPQLGGSEQQIEDLASRFENIPDIKICGIMLTVYEENQGSFSFHDRVIIKDIIKTAGESESVFSGDFIYEKIKYGKNYLFEARLICIVDSIFQVEDGFGIDSLLGLGAYLILSDKIATYVNCIENVPPEPPVFLTVNMDYSSQKPEISWQFPLNLQRDIKKFYIFKRKTLNQPFTLVQVNNFDNSEVPSSSPFKVNPDIIFDYRAGSTSLWPNKFIDYDFSLKDSTAIYAIISEDAHGMSSGYSAQLFVKYDKINNRFTSEIISRSGAPQPYPNLFINQDFFIDVIKQSNYTRCNVFFDPEYYKLFKTVNQETNEEEEIDYIKFTGRPPDEDIEKLKTEFPYKFHFINVDQQLDQTFEINIADQSGIPEGIPAAQVNKNFTFDFKL